MKIAVIGAGFTGLSAAHNLIKRGHKISVFEESNSPGGLAGGLRESIWDWTLEHHYHHIFTSDTSIIKLAGEVNCPVIFFRPKTKSLIDNRIYPMDSALDVIKFTELNILERLRLGLILAYLKFSPFQKWMEKIPASLWLKKYLGKKSFEILWKPLLTGKFQEFENNVPLSWFWARIKKRSQKLGYPLGGFQNLADKIKENIEKKGGQFYFSEEIKEIPANFDKVIFTTPFSVFQKIAPNLPKDYVKRLEQFNGLSALTLVLILKEPFLKDGTYWLNICQKDFPFLSAVEHTNFIDKKYYNNGHIVYIGKYLPMDHPYMKMSKGELLKIYDPYLKKLNPTYHLSLITYHLFKAPFAQPIITLNYSKLIPPFETPLKNVYIANMQQVYPWDRGTNYAVEMGEKIVDFILK